MTQVTPTIKYYAWINSAWVELAWAADTVRVQQGILSTDPTVRIASVGQMDFNLLNEGDIYTPGHSSALTGWRNGVKIKQVIAYGGNDYPSIWHVEPKAGIQIDARPYGTRKARVRCLDWFDYAMKQPVGLAAMRSDITADQLIEELLLLTSIQPANTSLDAGVETFTTALDTSTQDASVYSELAKIALSEWGYIYLRPDTTDGETLYFENRNHRNGMAAQTVYDTDKTFYAETIPFDAEVVNGQNVINSVKVYAYPRRLDTSVVTLFTLSEPIQIASGQSFTLRGYYTNPTGGARCNGYDMVTPVATTDYLANTASDGSGTNKTADISVEAGYGTNGFEHIITNNSTVTIWVTMFKCRGKGIYVENAIDYIAEDTDSIKEIGEVRKTIYQKYQKNLNLGTNVADSVLYFDREPENRIQSIKFYANRSDACMKAFLNLGIGDMIRIESTKGGVDALHYIQGIQYRIMPGRMIEVNWIVKQIFVLSLGLSLVGCSFRSFDTFDMIDYGTVPQVENLDEMTISAWIYLASPIKDGAIAAHFAGNSGWFFVNYDDILYYYDRQATGGLYYITGSELSAETWHHVVMTMDRSLFSNVPKMYVDGTEVTIIDGGYEGVGGDFIDDSGNHLTVGNYLLDSTTFGYSYSGYIVNPRIYNAILDQSAVTALYNAGRWDTSTETTNLVWHGDCYKSNDIDFWNGANVVDDIHCLIDNVNSSIGKGVHSPVPFTDTSSPEYIKSLLHFDYPGTPGDASLLGSGGIVTIGNTIDVPADTALIVFATYGGVPILGGVTATEAISATAGGGYVGALYYIPSPSSGVQTLTGSAVYWWAVDSTSGILLDTASDVNDLTLRVQIETHGSNLTFCHTNDYFDKNLEITETNITEDFDNAYGGRTRVDGRYTGSGPADLTITRTTNGDIASRQMLVAASFAYSSATNIVDESGKTWTANGAAALDETVKKLGNGSLVLDGASGTYLSTPDHADFVLGADDWTIDFWVRFTDVTTPTFPTLVSQYVDANNSFRIQRITSTNRIRCVQEESGSDVWKFECDFTPVVDTWYHLAFVRSGNTPYIFIDGVSCAVAENPAIAGKTAADLGAAFIIGAQTPTTQNVPCYIDEFRYSKGVARWTADFTTPASNYAS